MIGGGRGGIRMKGFRKWWTGESSQEAAPVNRKESEVIRKRADRLQSTLEIPPIFFILIMIVIAINIIIIINFNHAIVVYWI